MDDCLSQNEAQSPLLQADSLHFRYFDPFRNQSASKSSGVENRGPILHFLTPVKLAEGWARCVSEFYELSLGSNL